MLPYGRRGTLWSMSIRAAISGLLAGDGELSDPAAALEEAGFDNIPAEAFGTALTHFSDTATLGEADALAPVVTRTGPIPFEESDLPESDLDVESDDAFDLFASTVTTVHQDFGESDLDDVDDLDEQSASQSSVVGERLDAGDEADFDFGQPSPDPEAHDSPEDPPAEQSPELSEQTTAFDNTGQVQSFDDESEVESIDSAAQLSDDDPDDTFDDELDIDL